MCGVAVSSATFSKASRPVETKLKASGVGSGPQPLIASETDEAQRARCSVRQPTAENGGIEYGGLPVGAVIGIVKLFGNACGAVDVSDSVAEYSG